MRLDPSDQEIFSADESQGVEDASSSASSSSAGDSKEEAAPAAADGSDDMPPEDDDDEVVEIDENDPEAMRQLAEQYGLLDDGAVDSDDDEEADAAAAQAADAENGDGDEEQPEVIELVDDSVQGFFDHQGLFFPFFGFQVLLSTDFEFEVADFPKPHDLVCSTFSSRQGEREFCVFHCAVPG